MSKQPKAPSAPAFEVGESSRNLIQQLGRLVDAGISIVQVRTREPARILETLRMHLSAENKATYREFDMTFGNRRDFNTSNYGDHHLAGDGQGAQYLAALRFALDELNNAKGFFSDPESFLYQVFNMPVALTNGNPAVIELLKVYATVLPTTRACLIFITGEDTINVPLGTLYSLDAPTPTEAELEAELRTICQRAASDYKEGIEILDEEFAEIARLGAGMTKAEFSDCVCMALVDYPQEEYDALGADVFMEGVARGKTEVVKQSEILEMFHAEDMDNVAGMAGLKHWIEHRRNAFSQSAIEFGIEPPKAVALVGVPGTGKSLAAKATAHELRVPLLRLDFGKVFGKWVGESESRMRAALAMVASMGRVVLMVDEIDKALGGIGGGGTDSGTSSRVLGAFLTWMQENKSGCLVMVTANRIDGLPPELFRKGRMDQIFSVGLPNGDQRKEVLAVHLRKRNRSIEDFDQSELQAFVRASEDYVPAEIEQALKDALIYAFNEDTEEPKLEMRHILTALENSVPMSKSHADQIAAITAWAETHAVSVDVIPDARRQAASSVTSLSSRRAPRRPTTH